MARYMVDSTSPADALAQDADLYAGYTDGRYVNVAALRAGTDKPVVEISAVGTNSGVVGDCEPGCIWPQAEIVDWVLMRRRSGVEPTVYVGAANLASVVAAFDQAGVARPVAFWTAHYTNTPHYCGEGCSYGRGLGVNVVATQYGGDLIGHYDANTVKDYWPGVDSSEHTAGSGTAITDPADIGGALTPTKPDMTRRSRMILSKTFERWIVVDPVAGKVRVVSKSLWDGLKADGFVFRELSDLELSRLEWVGESLSDEQAGA